MCLRFLYVNILFGFRFTFCIYIYAHFGLVSIDFSPMFYAVPVAPLNVKMLQGPVNVKNFLPHYVIRQPLTINVKTNIPSCDGKCENF